MTHRFDLGSVYELPFPDASVDTIITDPPWHFEMRGNTKAVRASNFKLIADSEWRGGDTAVALVDGAITPVHAPTPLTEMYRVLKPGGHLYVFVPERKLQMALESFTGPMGVDSHDTFDWNDRFEHFNTIVWAKTRRDGTGLRMGLGHTYRNAYELVLCLSKGRRRPLLAKNVPNVIFAAPITGSVKPSSIYGLLARASTPPGGVIVDPFAGSDPLGRAQLEEFTTISRDIEPWGGGPVTEL